MMLLIMVFASVISTLVWYFHAESKMKYGMLCLMFWGASLMWFVDAVVEYIEKGAEYFNPSAADMLNDTYLGLSVVALALVIWLAAVLIKDPNGIIKKLLIKETD